MVLLVHATLQWQSIGEKQSEFLMLGDMVSEHGHLRRSASEPPEERFRLPSALGIHPHSLSQSVAGVFWGGGEEGGRGEETSRASSALLLSARISGGRGGVSRGGPALPCRDREGPRVGGGAGGRDRASGRTWERPIRHCFSVCGLRLCEQIPEAAGRPSRRSRGRDEAESVRLSRLPLSFPRCHRKSSEREQSGYIIGALRSAVQVKRDASSCGYGTRGPGWRAGGLSPRRHPAPPLPTNSRPRPRVPDSRRYRDRLHSQKNRSDLIYPPPLPSPSTLL
ncbi:hypothetical protein SKAU_G00195870 [Synaphobranchus kaupii]|uniref:Uncharacterized protein n=1 Tax=Synaphobranchus kaupii TaxID=118154 RepID=A0A9Q1FEG0_SYNKA|nr:hypothetical protein SKAU_G00195870 [Synaphobranchus kaupii]